MARRITVFGAYGHTARFIVAELRRRGWAPVLSSRDPARLAAVGEANGGAEIRPATIQEPVSLDRALAGAEAVVNCAGPFGETAPAVIEAALRAGVHYLDITGETLVAMATFERFADGGPSADAVRQAGTVVAPAVGFFGALGDLLATVALDDWPSADSIAIATALDSWRPTRGTRLAGARRAGRRVVFRDDRLAIRPAKQPQPQATWDFPAPVGRQEVLGEFSNVDVVTVSRHLRVRRIDTYINLAPISDVSDPDTPGPEPADESGRSAQTFLVDVVARRGTEARRAVASGRDIYAITAPIVVEAAERVLDGRAKASGVITAGEAFDARAFLEALAARRLSLTDGHAVARFD
jgi:short subunit dehydrogenase-like uncharacterized protein